MAEEQAKPQVAIPLSTKKKNTVTIGCMCMMLSVGLYGTVFATLVTPILEGINASGYVSLFGIMGSIGLAIMTPIGGKLGDILGRRNIVVIPGIVCAISGIVFPFMTSLVPVMFFRFMVGTAQGAFAAAPYIIVSLINERKDVPRAMGLLATSVAIGSFGGGFLSGALTDLGYLTVAILMPALPLVIGIVLIGIALPNIKRAGKISVDVPGIIALAVCLACILLSLNFGSSVGWGNLFVIAGFVVGIVALAALIIIEGKVKEPIIPLHLFKNKQYTFVLLVGFACYAYLPAMNIYAARGALKVIGTSTTIAGSLQMPRTIITIFLPTLAGIWLGKKAANAWKAMAIATICIAAGMVAMGFTSPSMSVLVYFAGLGATGIAESFRSTAITPTAQKTLSPADLGIGTALCNFVNSLATPISNALFGVAYNINTASDPDNAELIKNGVNSVFRTAAIIAVAGLLLVIFVIRPQMKRESQ